MHVPPTVLAAALCCAAQGAVPAPPVAPQREHQDLRFRTRVADPYHWLRDKTDAEVIRHLKAENAYTDAMTADQAGLRERLYQEMLGRIKQTDLSVPTRRGAWYYYTRTEEGRQYPIHCRKAAKDGHFDPDASEQVLLDLNDLAKGKAFLGLDEFKVSDAGDLLAYTTDDTGYRQYDLRVKDLQSGRTLADTAARVTSVAWAADGRTLFYSTEDPVTKRSNQVWRRVLGGAPSLVYEERDELYTVHLHRTSDRRFLVLDIDSTDTWECRVLPAAEPGGGFQVVLPRRKGHKYAVDHRDGLFYIRTNQDAVDFRIVTAPDGDPSPAHWKPFVPARPGVMVEGLELFRDHAVVREKAGALDRFRILDFRTGEWHELQLPEPVYAAAGGLTPDFEARQYRLSYQSMVTPATTYDYDLDSRRLIVRKRQEVIGYDSARYVCERLWATARDGAKVPISLVRRRDVAADGKAPLLLYGYGSYGYGLPAGFDANRVSLLDRGMVYAIAHIRGGDELGEGWHLDGMLMKKKNTFHDFIDCAEHLVKTGWTAKDRLVIEGGSAGGLLMGAVVNLRPDLFKAVHAAVPFVDVMNTMLDPTLPLTVGEYLEWGDPNQKPAYDYMLSYSPYDNLRRGAYPAMLVTSSLNDSQVGFWEPAKYVARLRTLKTDGNDLLLRMKLEPGGHGGASGRYDRLRDKAFEYAWILRQVGLR